MLNQVRCNVLLNTRPGMTRGRCGPSYNKTVCAIGFCSKKSYCSLSKTTSFRRKWGTKYDASTANTICFSKIPTSRIQKTIVIMKAGDKAAIKYATSMTKKTRGDARKIWDKTLKSLKEVSYKYVMRGFNRMVLRSKKTINGRQENH